MISFLYWYRTYFFIGHNTSSEIFSEFPPFFFKTKIIARARRASAVCSLFKKVLTRSKSYNNNHVTSISFINDLIFEIARSKTKKR